MATAKGPNGGEIVGHTSSGKPIYSSHLNSLGHLAHAAAGASKVPKKAPAVKHTGAVYRVTHGHDGKPTSTA